MLITEWGAKLDDAYVYVRTIIGQLIRVYRKHRLDIYVTNQRNDHYKHRTQFLAIDLYSYEAIIGVP